MLARTNSWISSLNALPLFTPLSCLHTILHKALNTLVLTNTTCTWGQTPRESSTLRRQSWTQRSKCHTPGPAPPSLHGHTPNWWRTFAPQQRNVNPWTAADPLFLHSPGTTSPACTYSTSYKKLTWKKFYTFLKLIILYSFPQLFFIACQILLYICFSFFLFSVFSTFIMSSGDTFKLILI